MSMKRQTRSRTQRSTDSESEEPKDTKTKKRLNATFVRALKIQFGFNAPMKHVISGFTIHVSKWHNPLRKWSTDLGYVQIVPIQNMAI